MSDEPRPENLSYTLMLTQEQINEAVTRYLKVLGKIPDDDSAEAHIAYWEYQGYGSSIDIKAEVIVKVHDAKSLINVLRLEDDS